MGGGNDRLGMRSSMFSSRSRSEAGEPFMSRPETARLSGDFALAANWILLAATSDPASRRMLTASMCCKKNQARELDPDRA